MSLKTIYVGRLDEEKGIKHLIFAIEQLLRENYDIIIHIYGQGQYTSTIISLATQYPKNILYHGWQKKNTILTKRKRMDYFIMPSQFLETFGLTACESLLCWVPVIGNKKGGLVPFIDDILNIQEYTWHHDWEKIYNLITYLIDNNIKKSQFSKIIEKTTLSYNKENRYHQSSQFLPHGKTTLFISDYINYNGGGIETHIHDSITILQEHHNKTQLYGHQAPVGKFALIKKLQMMARSSFNIIDSIKIQRKIKKNGIWLIRRHSISRVIGRLPLAYTSTDNHIISHHELGLFHPYPSKTYNIRQIPHSWSLFSFIKAGNTKNPIKIIAISGKYCLIRLIHKQLKKKVKTHIVPSERMIDIVKARHPQKQVICIPHFVDIE